MGNVSSLKSTENFIKVVSRLPKYLRVIYKKFTKEQFNEESMNLTEFEI